ncbi:hypothetical protein ['Paenibacillus yunnanensis' Narsing Rao et al. 2020]|uniref:hypothetical protein n=1 Tax=Paenibacillus tengchongensis TaxID=2608684 RepID=UPI0016525214|nr:hypothetical protein [Paenibacillus tengchongensis]
MKGLKSLNTDNISVRKSDYFPVTFGGIPHSQHLNRLYGRAFAGLFGMSGYAFSLTITAQEWYFQQRETGFSGDV